jgi:hypothetical protein
MKNIEEKLQEVTGHYSRYIGRITANMRLILLILFGILSGYLVMKVNALVSDKPAQTSVTDTKQPRSLTARLFPYSMNFNLKTLKSLVSLTQIEIVRFNFRIS